MLRQVRDYCDLLVLKASERHVTDLAESLNQLRAAKPQMSSSRK